MDYNQESRKLSFNIFYTDWNVFFDSQLQTFQMTQGFDTIVMKVLNLIVLSKPSGNIRIESNRETNRNILI